MPAEWEPHAATWFSWPRPDGISFPDKYDTVPPVYANLIRELVKVEEVNINVWDAEMEAEVRRLLQKGKHAAGPRPLSSFPRLRTVVPRSRPDLPRARERRETRARHRRLGLQCLGRKISAVRSGRRRSATRRETPRTSAVFTRHCHGRRFDGGQRLRHLADDGKLSAQPESQSASEQGEIEQYLCDYLGVTNVLWLGDGIVGDDTDGHIDDLSRFVNPTTVVTVVEEDPSDENYPILQENLKRLRTMRDERQRPLRIVELPMCGLIEHEGQRLPASYANFYIANQIVLVPTYRHANDARALEILQKEFPDRRVIGIDSMELIWGLGSFHCISQQEPV